MPNHYPTADEQADRLLPYRWQVQTIEDARKLVRIYLGSTDEAVVLAFYRRCSQNYKREIE